MSFYFESIKINNYHILKNEIDAFRNITYELIHMSYDEFLPVVHVCIGIKNNTYTTDCFMYCFLLCAFLPVHETNTDFYFIKF